jgi:acetoin utilization deacetylase AcuC-like enzyme
MGGRYYLKIRRKQSKRDISYIFALEGGYNLTASSESVVIITEELFSA